ncbi:hypothetical protein Pcinc_018257 [Petrolisthes cinctipes]|uniref:Thyroglobulin type-1 domain-containing protein n=1 Tax=Petrolisthes cinctipes TaxID=88211 RepID=A0AAE1FMS6_PETCI|nr:hypothetical protein Pcinc_018257 [Petrolisthes cinctipes]
MVVLAGRCVGDYIHDSILCDDVEAICDTNDLPYDKNETLCGPAHFFLNPKECNCGTFCLWDLAEGAECNTKSVLSYPSRLCGPQLTCVPDPINVDEPGTCKKNSDWPCLNLALQYEVDQEAGVLGPGRYKPNCDDFGRYSPVQCSPSSTCYCVNPEGRRLFGESLIADQDKMDCRCAVYWDEIETKGFSQGLRCLPNGNFDSLNCQDNICFCFDEDTNTIPYGPFPLNSLLTLPCYNTSVHREEYYNPCHKQQLLWDSQSPENMVIVAEKRRPVCTPDGYYAPVQQLGNTAYCSDLHGNLIEEFSQPIEQTKEMTCNCARRRQIMEESGMGASKPKCCPNGEYYPWQKRGLLAYCVDLNGNQYNELSSLPATQEMLFLSQFVDSNLATISEAP